MKKMMSVLLTVAMVLAMVACGGDSPGETSGSLSKSSSGTGSAGSVVGSADSAEDVSPGSSTSGQAANGDSSGGVSSAQQTEQLEATIEETVLVDEAGVKITAKELELDGSRPGIKLLIENNSGMDLTVQGRNSSVNGYMIDTSMSCDVVNEKKANDTLYFKGNELEKAGVSDLAEFEFTFDIFSTDTWDTYLETDPIHVRTSLADTVTQTVDDSGTPIYDENGVRIIVRELYKDNSDDSQSIEVFIDNSSEQNLCIQTRDVSVNGFMLSPVFSCDIISGKHIIDEIKFKGRELNENGITDIELVELSFYIFTLEGWDTVAESDSITLNFADSADGSLLVS